MRIPLDLPPGLNGDDTSFSAQARWSNGSEVRFRNGKAETVGGWESLVSAQLTGVCRTILPFTDNSGILNIGFGTHSKLELWQGGALYDITPTLALPSATLGSDPIATTNTSAVVTVTQNGHPHLVGDSVIITGATAVATVTINGTWTVLAITTNTWTFTAGSSANATAAGGGTAVVVANQRAYAAGQIDGTGGAGFGTGGYGIGGYGQASDTEYFPRTWSLGPWGENLLACPRNGTIYSWANDTTAVATPLTNAPANVTAMVIAPNGGGYQVFALGCNEESSGDFNPMCIRHSSVRNNTEWTTSEATTAREYTLTGGGRIVAGAIVGAYLLVWTNDSLFLGQFVGDLDQPWRFDRVARHCGLIGPNAVVIVGQAAFWVSPDRQFYNYVLGGNPEPIPCQIREDFAENLAASQGDKVIASATAEFSEVRFDYPDSRDGFEISRYVAVCVSGPDQGAWYKGLNAWTARVDAGPSDYPIATNFAGHIYYVERGATADGGVRPWVIETADQYLDESQTMQINGVWPDFTNQEGPVTLEVIVRLFPQGDETTTGTIAIAPGANKADFRITGRLARIRLSGTGTPSRMRLGKLDFDVTPGGGR